MTTLQPVRGTQSLLGEDADRLAAVVAAFDRVRAIEAAGLAETLQGEGPFTIFAPVNSAFEKIPAADLQAVLVQWAHALEHVLQRLVQRPVAGQCDDPAECQCHERREAVHDRSVDDAAHLRPDLAVIDVSFISLDKVLPRIAGVDRESDEGNGLAERHGKIFR